MKRGFTIVEITVVITIIAILSTVLLFVSNRYQAKAVDSQAKSLAVATKAGAERYYRLNNEYPLASAVFGGTPTGSRPASYSTASNVLKISTQLLDGDKIDLVPCSGASCTFTDTTKVYYLTKADADGTANRAYTITSNNCTYTLPTSENGPTSFVILYYNKENSGWNAIRSNNGVANTSDNLYCPFT